MSELQERIAKLELRLQDGFARIGAAMERGDDVSNWERHWIDLLREFEELNDNLTAEQPSQSTMPLGRVEIAA